MSDCVDSGSLYGEKLERIRSFEHENCSSKLSGSKEGLANEGLYYVRNSTVRCFSCSFIQKWTEEIDIEDMRWKHAVNKCNHIEHMQEDLLSNLITNDTQEAQEKVKTDAEDSLEELRAENRRLKDEMFCRKCKKNVKEVVFRPCGHLSLCSNCYHSAIDKCTICWSDIVGIYKNVKVKFSKFLK